MMKVTAEQFQIYVILNGIKTKAMLEFDEDVFQIYVILNGIKTQLTQTLICSIVLDLCHFKWY